MREFIIALIESSITMSVIILGYMAIMPILSRKFTAKGRYYAWLVIVIGLIIPFRFHSQASAFYVDTLIPALKSANSSPVDQAASYVATASSATPWYVLAGSLWLAGAIVFLAIPIIRHRRFLKMVKRWSCRIADQQVLSVLHDVQAKLGITRKVDLKVCPGISSPILIGFVRPTILLPSGTIPTDGLWLIFKHELVHYKRRDLWYKTLVFLAMALHWFNPIVYRMAREIDIQCEISCDEEVVKNTDLAERKRYVETIISMIKEQSRGQTAFSTNFYGGKKGIKHRVYSIMDTRMKKWGASILAVLVVATFTTGALLKLNKPSSDAMKPVSVSKVEASPEKELPVNEPYDPISPTDNLDEDQDGAAEPSKDGILFQSTKDNRDSDPSMTLNPETSPRLINTNQESESYASERANSSASNAGRLIEGNGSMFSEGTDYQLKVD